MNAAPQVNEILFIDRASGEILEDRYNSQTKTMYWLGTWNYPLHVGTIWGLPTKIIWLVTCIILMTSPVTGVWMWWERRPTGRLGLPRRVDARRPRWLVATVTATSILLPALGLSVVVLLVGEQLVARLRKHELYRQRGYRPSGAIRHARHGSENPWVDDASRGQITSEPSQKLRCDVFRRRIRASEKVCHTGELLAYVTR